MTAVNVVVAIYGTAAGLTVVLGAVLLVDPRPLMRRLRRFRQPSVAWLGLPAGRPLCERRDYPSGVAGREAIHAEMRVWGWTVAELADLAETAPLIEAAYLPVGVTR